MEGDKRAPECFARSARVVNQQEPAWHDGDGGIYFVFNTYTEVSSIMIWGMAKSHDKAIFIVNISYLATHKCYPF